MTKIITKTRGAFYVGGDAVILMPGQQISYPEGSPVEEYATEGELFAAHPELIPEENQDGTDALYGAGEV